MGNGISWQPVMGMNIQALPHPNPQSACQAQPRDSPRSESDKPLSCAKHKTQQPLGFINRKYLDNCLTPFAVTSFQITDLQRVLYSMAHALYERKHRKCTVPRRILSSSHLEYTCIAVPGLWNPEV